MFVPVWDENPLRAIPFQIVTLALIAINVAVFLLEASGLSQQAIAEATRQSRRRVRALLEKIRARADQTRPASS